MGDPHADRAWYEQLRSVLDRCGDPGAVDVAMAAIQGGAAGERLHRRPGKQGARWWSEYLDAAVETADRLCPSAEAVETFNRGLPEARELVDPDASLLIYRDGKAPPGRLVIVLEDRDGR